MAKTNDNNLGDGAPTIEAERLWVWRVDFRGTMPDRPDSGHAPVLVAAPDIKAAVDAAVDRTGIKLDDVTDVEQILSVHLRYKPEEQDDERKAKS